jgi:multiple sugar transport system substrate-binding protein
MTQLKVEFAAGGGPDVTIMNTPSGIPWIGRGIFLSLQDLVTSDKTYGDNLKALVPWTIDAYTREGKLYGTPITAESTAFFYNEDLVKKAGLTPFAEIENDPDKWNWNALRDYAKAMSQGTGDDPGRIYGIHSLGPMQANWLNYMVGNGGEFLSPDGLKCNIGQEPAIQTIQFLHDLRYKDKVAAPPDPFVQGQGVSHTELFQLGRLGSSSEGEWQVAGYNSFNNKQGVPFTYNIAQQPFSPYTRKRSATGHTLAVVVNKFTKHQQESFEFVKFMARPDVQLWISTEGWGSLSANPKTYDQWVKDPSPPKNRQAVIASHDYNRLYPNCPLLETSEVQDPLNSVLHQQIWYEKRDVVEGLKFIEQETNKIIQKALTEQR